ncbi:glycosyltransferase family 2 protein [Lewinella sp. LCG006]|uniref:glycosyltransferase family 2 protein n=1 Tax=Lewinella sp. LCG006 TaxID=3231911 RepID=UPI0034611FF3
MQLSIILPTYNVEKYIERCIKSIFIQKLVSGSFEVIVVDDESPDNSITIVNELSKSFKEIKIISQKNKGLAGARNTGIRNAKGKYLLFLDPDDYIEPNCLSKMLSYMDNLGIELGMFNQNLIKNGERLQRGNPQLPENRILTGSDMYFGRTSDSACKYLLQTDFIKINNLYFFEEAVYLEDAEWSARVFATVDKAAYKDLYFYNYDLRESSLVTSGVGLTWPAVEGYLKCAKNLHAFKCSLSLSPAQASIVNNVIAKFVTLPITLFAAKKRLVSMPLLIRSLSENGFNTLELEGLKGLRLKQAKSYNISPYYLFINSLLGNIKKTGLKKMKNLLERFYHEL